MGMSTGRLRDPVAGSPQEQMMICSRDVRRTSLKQVLSIQLSQTYFDKINKTL